MSKKDLIFAARGKFLKNFMLIFIWKSTFLSFSTPQFNLKSWVLPFILNIFPSFSFIHLNFFSGSFPFGKFQNLVPPFFKGGTHYGHDASHRLFNLPTLILNCAFQNKMQKIPMTVAELSVFKGFAHLVPSA